MKAIFYKLRILLIVYILRFLALVFRVEVPPAPSATAIIVKGNQLLFIDLSYQNGYGLPGGLVKAGENTLEALKREVYEETGLIVKDVKFFNSYASTYAGIPTITETFITETAGKIRPSFEGSPVWLEPKDAISRLAYSDASEILHDYMNLNK
jgi:8-oxo-dGTP pyrophosphatase MutT (NUDIX family)